MPRFLYYANGFFLKRVIEDFTKRKDKPVGDSDHEVLGMG
jgi:hypothetical protein